MPTMNVAKESELHKKLVERVAQRVRLGEKGVSDRLGIWKHAEELTMAYLPESEADSKRRIARESGEPKYTTIQVPYTYALMMSAHTYWTSVFFARSPIHQYSGRHGEGEQQTQAMEALIGYQVEVGGAVAPYYIWLYDAAKYGIGILGTYWCKEKAHYGDLVEMDDGKGGTQLMQTTQEVEIYAGNKVYNVSPFDFLTDPRKSVKKFQEGEFVAERKRMGWNEILKRKDAGWYNSNIDHLKKQYSDKDQNQGSSVLKRPEGMNSTWLSKDENDKHPAGATFWEVQIELVPAEWGLGDSLTFPQKWAFTITEDLELLIGVTPMGYAHCKFSYDILECEIEGYGQYTRGMPEMALPIQNTMDWLLNTHFYNIRAALNNQFIVDPSKLVIRDVQKGGPGFIWRLRPEAFGTDITKMFMQVPVQDVTKQHLQDFQMMLGIGERVFGINDQIMGASTGTSRKTATEVRTSSGFGVNRMKTISEFMSASGFAPHSQKLVQNSQQLYDASQKLRRVGSFALEAGQRFLQVTPQDIAGFFDFVPVDGTLPVDRMAQANLWKEIMGNLQRMPPQVSMGYDWTRIFAWVANLSGLKNIDQFKIQVVPDAQLAAQATAGNVIPMPGRGVPGRPGGSPVQPGNSASTAAGLESLNG